MLCMSVCVFTGRCAASRSEGNYLEMYACQLVVVQYLFLTALVCVHSEYATYTWLLANGLASLTASEHSSKPFKHRKKKIGEAKKNL